MSFQKFTSRKPKQARVKDSKELRRELRRGRTKRDDVFEMEGVEA